MSSSIHFLIGALRAIIEMLGLCLIGQGTLALLVGRGRCSNPVYQLFALITRPPRALLAKLFPKAASESSVGMLLFVFLLLLWLGLALLRRFI